MTWLGLVTNIRNCKRKTGSCMDGCMKLAQEGHRYSSHGSKTSLRKLHVTTGHTWRVPSHIDLDGWTGPTASQQPGGEGEGRPWALRAPGWDVITAPLTAPWIPLPPGLSQQHRQSWHLKFLDHGRSPSAVSLSRTPGPLSLPLPIWGQVREAHPFVEGRDRESQSLFAWSGKQECGELARENELGFAGKMGHPTLPMQAQVLSVLMCDPCHLCQNTVLYPEATRTPRWAEPRLHTCLWALRVSILFCK